MDLRKLSRVQDSGNKTKFTEEERKKLAEEGLALPDGSFPIRNKQDLKDAVKAIGLARSYEKTKKWIIKRARELNSIDELPESWKVKDDNISDSKKDRTMLTYNGADVYTSEANYMRLGKISRDEAIKEFRDTVMNSKFDADEIAEALNGNKNSSRKWKVVVNEKDKIKLETEDYMGNKDYLEVTRIKVEDSKDYKDVSLMDYDGDIEIGMRVYEKLASGNKAYGKVTGVNYHAGTVNIEGEEYDDSYDVPWEEVFVA